MSYKEYIVTPTKEENTRKPTVEKVWGYFNFNTLLGVTHLRRDAYREVEKIMMFNEGLVSKRMFNVRKVTVSYE